MTKGLKLRGRKVSSVFLVLLMLVSAIYITPISVSAENYNSSAAVAYASKYWNNYNPDYNNYNSVGGDCANFVSQCLYAGGIPQDGTWYNGSSAWISCSAQINYFRNKGYTVIDYAQASDIKVGNPVYYYNGNSMAHTAICVGYSSNGTPLVAAHNKNHWEAEWTLGGASWWGGSTRRVTILMPDSQPVKNAWLNINRNEIIEGENITFNFGAENGVGLYTIGIDKDGDRIYTTDTWDNTFSYTFYQSGDYSAYITAYGDGMISDSNRVYFKVYPNVPASNAWLNIDKSKVAQGQSITFNFGADNSAGVYTIGIDKEDTRIYTEDIRTNSFTYTFNEVGNYSAYVTCYGYGGLSDTNRVYFTVYDKKPEWAKVSLSKNLFYIGENVTFNLSSDVGLNYTVGIDEESTTRNRIDTYDTWDSSYTRTFNKAGNYSCYITTYNQYGLADSERIYFTVYDKKPEWAKVSLSKNLFYIGENVTFNLSSDVGLNYTVGIDEESTTRNRIDTYDTWDSSYTRTFNKAGNYSCYITTYNQYGLADSERIYFRVYDNSMLLGDINLDKTLDIKDTVLMQRYLLGMISLNEQQLEYADYNNDGKFSLADIVAVQRYIMSA